eukprot:TRINITY_DN8897_c0_g1_i1.p1 TRINITY_DN8897_c0_g1~~TRINITY_DN8897_c0_g1_i1.p1  ORF type:complete len:585 (+),score=186.92 TRINITY_DN8897_c0_g1_i1:185-1939(+)
MAFPRWLTACICAFVLATSRVDGAAGYKRAGILYEGWHGFAANAIRTITQQLNGTAVTVEQVIRSNGNLSMYDMLDKYGMSQASDGFYYQVEPQAGFYCIYRKRPGEVGIIPDCPGISDTLTRHAKQLLAGGIDFIAIDSTNLPTLSNEADVIQLRPIEVVFEEWAALRAQGINTPAITVWPCIPAGATLWQSYLELYNNETYSDLVYVDPGTNKKVIFIVDPPGSSTPPDPAIIATIESNGGRNDITCVRMWAQMPLSAYAGGEWGFFTPCFNGTDMTDNIVGLSACGQPVSVNSPIGTEVSASVSYQLQYSSIPFGAPGKLSGLTMKKMFQQVFAAQPNYVFISSFNEFVAQPQPNPYRSRVNTGFSMGLEWDSYRENLWVDTFGAEFSRDIEPTVEYGDYYYELMASCLRVYKSGTGPDCNQPSEECCNITSSDIYTNVWSLALKSGGDNLLTTSVVEKNVLVNGGGWREVCNPFTGTTLFCVDDSMTDGRSSPFILLAVQQPDSVPLYRCINASVRHFFSLQQDCEGAKTESQLGFVSTKRSGNTPRSIRRCHDQSTGVYFHSLDIDCPTPGSPVLGYVR